MFSRSTMPVLGLAALLLSSGPALAASAASMQSELHGIAQQWAHITYQLKDDDAKEEQMRSLADVTDKVVAEFPDRAEPLIWAGIVASSEARYAGAFSALHFAKQSRDLLEKAGRIDFRALDGGVPTSLGALYYMVPGFPIGFGDNDKARRYLEQAVEMSPNGLDSNMLYGDFLYHEGEYNKAAEALKRGLTAPVNPDRPVWDAGRRAEIQALLKKVNEKLASQ